MKYKSIEMREAYAAAGFRERFAMEHGHKIVIYVNGNKCYRFRYSNKVEYQDANGAIYNTITKKWIN